VKRFPFLDWMRGLAVVIMIQCHVFNSFAVPAAREGGPYVLSQFVGGMAAPLFLFMAGMTLAFQMDSQDRKQRGPAQRWTAALRRAGYVWGIAYLFRLTNCLASIPHVDWHEFTKVDILNCMGLSMAVFAAAAALEGRVRARWVALGALAVAAAAPLIANVEWGSTPTLIQEYLAPGRGRGHFAFFPNAAYVGFGLAAGTVVKHTVADRFERLMQWCLLLGLVLVIAAQYFSNIPYSIYTKSSFWTDSPALVLIRAGIALLSLSSCYLWTEYVAGAGWSWMQVLGKNSLMVYWIHVMLVYGNIVRPLKQNLSIWQTALATAVVTAMMVVMSEAWLRRKARKAAQWRMATAVAGAEAV
jgi:uncharacterized membrane protein